MVCGGSRPAKLQMRYKSVITNTLLLLIKKWCFKKMGSKEHVWGGRIINGNFLSDPCISSSAVIIPLSNPDFPHNTYSKINFTALLYTMFMQCRRVLNKTSSEPEMGTFQRQIWTIIFEQRKYNLNPQIKCETRIQIFVFWRFTP